MLHFYKCWFPFLVVLWAGSLFAQELPQSVPKQNKALDKIWVLEVPDFTEQTYRNAVESLVTHYEIATGIHFEPGQKRRAGIKVYTNSGAGLRTPPKLVEAMIDFLVSRGYQKTELFIIDLNTDSLWRAGYISSRANPKWDFMGVPVYALDAGVFFDPEWFYDSPLPSQYVAPVQLKNKGGYDIEKSLTDDRKSFLPVPLLLNVDFWVNLPVITDHPELGINGALANLTLWNISNQYRFMNNTAGASAAIAEIAAIPELHRSLAFSIVSLERFQYMGGPIFNSSYVRSYNEIYLSSNAVALDRIFLEKINRARETMGFSPISPIPPVFEYAKSLDLGDFERGSFEILETK
jgi:hypothetical protein